MRTFGTVTLRAWTLIKLRTNTLRAKADPDVTLDPTKDGGVIMRVAFAKGDFLPKDAGEPNGPGPGGTGADPQADSEAGGDDAPPPPRHHHHPQQ